MKFDTIIQNPPYNRSLHLDFLEKGLDLLDENGDKSKGKGKYPMWTIEQEHIQPRLF